MDIHNVSTTDCYLKLRVTYFLKSSSTHADAGSQQFDNRGPRVESDRINAAAPSAKMV